jgi:hypothetical protein
MVAERTPRLALAFRGPPVRDPFDEGNGLLAIGAGQREQCHLVIAGDQGNGSGCWRMSSTRRTPSRFAVEVCTASFAPVSFSGSFNTSPARVDLVRPPIWVSSYGDVADDGPKGMASA